MNRKSIKRIEAIKTSTEKELVERAVRAKKAVSAEIEKAAKEKKAATNDANRRALYAEILKHYNELARGIDEILKQTSGEVAETAHASAVLNLAENKLAQTGATVAFDAKRIDKYWSLLHPNNAKYLAAVYTDKMAPRVISALRQAFLDTFRQAQLEGWTGNQIHKNLQSKWWGIARKVDDRMFVDVAGREWTNADYLRMLTRTTLHTVATESYIDTLVEGGDDLAMIDNIGENCPICDAWGGVIISLSGKSDKHPSYRQALDAGWKHPNCDCMLSGVVEALDGEEIDRQAGIKQPGPIKEDESAREYADKMQEYNDRIKLSAKQAQGMSKKQADIDLKRDKLRHRLRVAGLERFEESVAEIPDNVLAQLAQDELPRFEYTKKGDKNTAAAWNRKSDRGGVIHMDRNEGAEGGTEEDLFAQMKDLFEKSGVTWK